jgi:predicted hotdog family 3-hydroxylacyl-ACP dehydratase
VGIPDKVLIDKSGITGLIPQREPMVMIDRLLHNDDKKTVTSFKIEENNIFIRDGHLSEYGLIENIAQTAAARIGYIAMETGSKVPIGFIAGIKDLKILRLPEKSSVIITEIIIVDHVLGMTIITGQNSSEGKMLASCEMRIFLEQ